MVCWTRSYPGGRAHSLSSIRIAVFRRKVTDRIARFTFDVQAGIAAMCQVDRFQERCSRNGRRLRGLTSIWLGQQHVHQTEIHGCEKDGMKPLFTWGVI